MRFRCQRSDLIKLGQFFMNYNDPLHKYTHFFGRSVRFQTVAFILIFSHGFCFMIFWFHNINSKLNFIPSASLYCLSYREKHSFEKTETTEFKNDIGKLLMKALEVSLVFVSKPDLVFSDIFHHLHNAMTITVILRRLYKPEIYFMLVRFGHSCTDATGSRSTGNRSS